MISKPPRLKHFRHFFRASILSASTLTSICCMALLLMLAPSLAAEQAQDSSSNQTKKQWYQINFLVFQHLKAKTQGNGVEQWPKEAELSYPNYTVYLKDRTKQPINPFIDTQDNYRTIVNPESGLQQEKRNIRLSAGFRTLFYKQWYQELGAGVTGKAIAVSGGKSFDGQQQLEGWVRFSQKRYLHLEVDLWLHDYDKSHQELGLQTKELPQPIPEPEKLMATLFDFGLPPMPVPVAETETDVSNKIDEEIPAIPFYIRKPRRVITFVMHQKRRMKSNELHHLDHPLLGVLVEAIPYEPKTVEKVDRDTAIWLNQKNLVQESK